MSILVGLLLLGSCGSASRTIEVEPSVERIVVGLVIGGVRDVLHDQVDRPGLRLRDVSMPSLEIDSEPRTGWRAWIAAGSRVCAYAADCRHSGSVEYSYRLRLRGLDIRRTTRIEDGRVSLLTDVYGRLGPRGELYHVQLLLSAKETRRGVTTIHGVASGWSAIGNRCRLVNSIASREISRGLADALLSIERGGIDVYRSADECLERLSR